MATQALGSGMKGRNYFLPFLNLALILQSYPDGQVTQSRVIVVRLSVVFLP
jgi:hypothetical protein